MKDKIEFIYKAKYIDLRTNYVWIAKLKYPFRQKYLWRNDVGWGLWNYGKGLKLKS
jgi:hypothetical protein